MLTLTEHEIFLLIYDKLPTLMGRTNIIIGLSEPKKLKLFIFLKYEHLKFHAQLS